MIATAPASGSTQGVDRTSRRDRVSFARLLWVAPLTIVVAVAVNLLIKFVAVSLDPSLARMGQLQAPLVSLTAQGAVGAVVVFAIVAAVVPRPILWYRILAAVALLASVAPDIALGMGGAAAGWAMRVAGPFLSLGGPSGPPPGAGGPPPGGGFPGGFPALSLEQVAVLMVLHTATFVVCVGLLTTLTRKPAVVTDAD
jgi:uncharacterized membrane protein